MQHLVSVFTELLWAACSSLSYFLYHLGFSSGKLSIQSSESAPFSPPIIMIESDREFNRPDTQSVKTDDQQTNVILVHCNKAETFFFLIQSHSSVTEALSKNVLD